ncbi:MAG TPA: TonB family protein [Pyrinomonadaceae bacterium]|jgi:Ca-activated chloride channel family protein
MKKTLFVLATLWLWLAFVLFANAEAQTAATEGTLRAVAEDGKLLGDCPLKNTNVKAEISGFLARVRVRQEFENNFADKIEAVYVFPLSQNAAVDQMTMRVGDRTIAGRIMKKEEAKQVYETAKTEGKTAALLDQNRPNIFTQAVANILPGEKITVEISYVETLKYEDGAYEFVFPTVVAPRYNPAQVTDDHRISAPVAATRAGHDISIEVNLDAGVPVENVASKVHEIESAMLSANRRVVKLKNEKDIPNRDFVLRYDVSGKKIADAVLAHRDKRGGFFTLMLQPPDTISYEDATPKEIVFVLDTSGSMSGFPIEKAKEAMRRALDGLHPFDTFNLITFAGETHVLFDKPVPASVENLRKAQELLNGTEGSGGTEMMTAIRAAFAPSGSNSHVRIVCFMTDGLVGNEAEIIAEVQKHRNARVFSFGIGESVNRFLLDKIAEEGRGEAAYVSLTDDGSAAAKRFHERVRSPLLTDISIDWNGLPVADVYPNRILDLFGAKPIILHGRFTRTASGTIRLRGKRFGQDFVREIPVVFPENEAQHDVLATLWARTRVDDLMSQDWNGIQKGKARDEVQNTITQLGLEYNLLTQFTSFVAVEDRIVTDSGQPARRVEVPVETPAGTKKAYKEWLDKDVAYIITQPKFELKQQATLQGPPINGSGIGRGQGSGIGGGNSAAQPNNVTATVEVTSDSAMVIDATDTKVQTNITAKSIQNLPINGRRIQNLPKGVGFSSALKTVPGTRAEGLSGSFSIDGASGSENVFIIDGQEVSNFRTGALNSANSVRGRVEDLIKPEYTEAAKRARAAGMVNVRIKIDESGKVTEAKAVFGNPLLRAAAEKAARETKFAPASVAGRAVKVIGTLVYHFKRGTGVDSISAFGMRAAPQPPAGKRLIAVESRLHPKIAELMKNPTAKAESVNGGKSEIIVQLKTLNPQTIAVLKTLGLEISRELPNLKAVVGKISTVKLAALAEMKSIVFISPKMD